MQQECSTQALSVLIEQSKENGSAPPFISNHWPAETEKITFSCYVLMTNKLASRRGIGVILDTTDIAENEIPKQGDNNIKPFEDRVRLYIDGEIAPDSSKAVWDYLAEVIAIKDGVQYFTGTSSQYDISWTPLLLPGKHTAKIEILTKSGEIFEFEWRFTLLL